MKLSHDDLARNGLAVVGDEIVPAQTPDPTWDMESLTAYAKRELGEFSALSKRTTVHLYRAGHALFLICQQKKQDREWMAWQRANKLPFSSVNDAIRLYQAAGSEAAVANLSLMEAYDRFGIQKRAKKAQGSSESVSSARRCSVTPGHDDAEDDRTGPVDAREESAEPDEDESRTPSSPTADSLEEIEEEAFKKQQAALREETPLTTATAIRNALVQLLERLAEQPTCPDGADLGAILREIAELADAAGWECANEQAAAV